MNKYEKAYDDCASGRFGSEHWNLIKELVDRATPSAVEVTDVLPGGFGLGRCPRCNKPIREDKNKYFHDDKDCGQALDWGEEGENK